MHQGSRRKEETTALQEGTMSNGDESKDVPQGASSLMGLFSPPPQDDKNEAVEDREQTSMQDPVPNGSTPKINGEGPSELREKFRRRSTVRSSNSSNRDDGDDDVEDDDDDDTNNKHAKTLMEMFKDDKSYPVPAKERHPPNALPPHERLPLLHNRKDSVEETAFGDLYPAAPPTHERQSSLGGFLDHLLKIPTPTDQTPQMSGSKSGRKVFSTHAHNRTRTMSEIMPAIDESKARTVYEEDDEPHYKKRIKEFASKHLQVTTFVGSCMFLLYHVVFCLAMGSSIIRKHSETPILGLMSKMAACGVIFASPYYIYRLGNKIPALYPTVDLFLAPFMAHLGNLIDETLEADESVEGQDEDQVFVATLAVLSGIGMIFSGTLLVMASKFKLANLGSYLPFPVLCGFFSAVGLLMWSLAFAVDNNGKSVHAVFTSGDISLIGNALLHHLPSLLIAVCMKWLGPLNPFLVSALVVCTVVVFYLVMAIAGMSLEEAREEEWFWSHSDLVYEGRVTHFGFDRWAPPAPFGGLNSLIEGKVHWGAVSSGMSTIFALSFLYMLRCSIHGTALKKNVSNLARPARDGDPISSPQMSRSNISSNRHRRLFSEALDIEAAESSTRDASGEKALYRAKDNNVSLETILLEYGHSLYVSAAVGSFGVVPSVAASPTMFSLGAEGVAPQYGSVMLLLIFYLTDFRLVGFIPKAAFSSLIVLAFLDIMVTWFFKSYQKTSDKMEWLVVPIIIIAAFMVGLLNAVFIGIAASTILFVANFFRSGVVKFLASGLSVRSTIERPFLSGDWLDRHGDLIQILVLQNYLFFGNASSILAYITTMFVERESESSDDDEFGYDLPPMPKIVILDFMLVTGMDTSTVDVISGVIKECQSHDCKVFLAGLSPRMRTTLSLGGVKPETGERSKRKIRFFPDLDSAMGKAEDMLLSDSDMYKPDILGENRRRLISDGDVVNSGFGFALRHIDEQHGREFAEGLHGLQKHTKPLELAPGQCLFSSDGGPVQENMRGFFFIEEGIIKIERDSSVTLTRGSVHDISLDGFTSSFDSDSSVGQMKARSASLRRRAAQMKGPGQERTTHFRVARVGPGWILGSMEGLSGNQNSGYHVAVSHCRLHHLPFSKMKTIEDEDPLLMLRFYKLLAHLMARRQEITIEQLATLHSIMSSPALTNPTRCKKQ